MSKFKKDDIVKVKIHYGGIKKYINKVGKVENVTIFKICGPNTVGIGANDKELYTIILENGNKHSFWEGELVKV